MTILQQSHQDTNHRVRSARFMSDKQIIDLVPRHIRRWIMLAQRLPLFVMLLFTMSVVFDNQSPIGTMAILQRWGVSQLEFSAACVVGTFSLLWATRSHNLQAIMHFLLGTLPLLFYILVTVSRTFFDDIPFTAAVIYAFAYSALMLFYWLAIGLAEWELRLNLKDRVEA